MSQEGQNIKMPSQTLRRKALSYYEGMLKKLKAEVMAKTVGPANMIERYLADHERELADIKGIFSRDDIIKDMSDKNLAFFGNFRTDNEARGEFLECLKAFVSVGMKISVAIDMPYSVRLSLCSYMNGSFGREGMLRILRKSIHESFLKGYMSLLDFLKSGKIPFLPIGFQRLSGKDIYTKDYVTARRLASFYLDNADRKMIVFVPDSWMARNHVPQALEMELAKSGVKTDFLRVFSGSDGIFLKLARSFKEHEKLAMVSKETYVFNLTHPIARYNAFFNHLEGEEEISDFSDRAKGFDELLQKINKGFDFKIDIRKVHYRLFSNYEIGFLEHLFELKCFNDKQKEEVLDYISRGESYFIPYSQTIYLNDLSVIHASEEAGHYMRYLMAGVERPKTGEDKFYASVINEALAFMSSKLLVPKRAPIGKRAVKKMLKGLSRTEKDSLAIHSLGYELGQRLFKKFREGRLAKRKIKGIFSTRFRLKGEARLFYEKLTKL